MVFVLIDFIQFTKSLFISGVFMGFLHSLAFLERLHHHLFHKVLLQLNDLLLIFLVLHQIPNKFQMTSVSLIMIRILSNKRLRKLRKWLGLLRDERFWLIVASSSFVPILSSKIAFHIPISKALTNPFI